MKGEDRGAGPRDTDWLGLRDRDGNPLGPYVYPSGKTQAGLIREITEAFDSSDVVFLHAVVGSGKSVVALRTVLEFGRGVVSVPTKVLSDQYASSYERDKYFMKDDGQRAKIGILKGRGNFRCMLQADRGRDISCAASCAAPNLPCRRPLRGDEHRKDALRECPHWGFVFPSNIAEDVKGARKATYRGVQGEWTWCTHGECPYWKQYHAYASSDAIVMNSAKWAAEVMIGRMPKTPVTVIDEADGWLDSLAVSAAVTGRTVEWLKKTIGRAAESYRMRGRGDRASGLMDIAKRLQGMWDESLTGNDPLGLAGFLVSVFEKIDETSRDLYWKLRLVLEYMEHAEWEIDRVKEKITYYIPYPKFVLQRFLERVGGKWLLMSATVQSPDILRDVFGVEPEFVEGRAEFPGTLVRRAVGSEVYVTNKKWERGDYWDFRKGYWRTLREILLRAARPGFAPVHASKYLPPWISGRIQRESAKRDDSGIYDVDGFKFSTKLDRGADLGGTRSVVLLKYPYPDLGDPLLRGLRRRLGPDAFWRYYRDMAKRGFVQQIGRTLRSDDDEVEFWSPDLTCHRRLGQWGGRIVEGSGD